MLAAAPSCGDKGAAKQNRNNASIPVKATSKKGRERKKEGREEKKEGEGKRRRSKYIVFSSNMCYDKKIKIGAGEG